MRAWAAILVLAGALVFAAVGHDAAAEAPTGRVEVIASFPHDRAAFTQGLVFHRGTLFESTGLYGHSTLREVEWQTGRVLRSVDVPREYFAEGLTLFGDRLIQLTYQEHKGFVYDLDFRRIGEFAYEGEGWGLAHDGARLLMSDGTNRLRFLDPTTFETVGTVDVFDDGVPVARLNELEWVRGEVWANVWQTDRIARIDPASGRVIGWLDLAGLLEPQERVGGDVLNGIAYDAAGDRVFVTGKWWPQLFAIRRPGAAPAPPPLPPLEGASPEFCFAETGFCARGAFLAYWQSHGGLAVNGFPISEAFTQTLEDGRAYRVQYFERVRLEYHPENVPPNDVLLGQFGRRIRPADPPVPPPAGPITQDGFYFAETGHYVPGRFFAFWNANGGLAQFGYPISEAIEERLEDGNVYRVQYFERARFELHPENQPPNDILLGQFGRRILAERGR